MGQRMNVQSSTATINNVRPIRLNNISPDEDRRSWFLRATNWIGITMARTESPHGWSFNPATITLSLVVAGGILTGGYLWGENVAERKHMMERLQKAEADAAEAKKFSIYATAGADEAAGHKPNQKEQK